LLCRQSKIVRRPFAGATLPTIAARTDRSPRNRVVDSSVFNAA
jgi:hypothetical protein